MNRFLIALFTLLSFFSVDANARPTVNGNLDGGMSYVILSKNKSFAEQVVSPNTVYEIRDNFDLRGANVKVPKGCQLFFLGGSIQGDGKEVLDLNDCKLLGNPRIENCRIKNPIDGQINLSWLGVGNNVAYNTATLKWLGEENVNLIVDCDITINKTIEIKNAISILGKANGENMHTLKAIGCPALKYHRHYINKVVISDVSIESDGTCIEFAGYAYEVCVRNSTFTAYTGDCLFFYDDNHTEVVGGVTYRYNNFHITLEHITVRADKGYGVTGANGNTCSFDDVKCLYCEGVFRNCVGLFTNCNGTFSTKRKGDSKASLAKHFFYWDSSKTYYGIKCIFINCNIENYSKEPFVDVSNVGTHNFDFHFIGSHLYLYANSGTGKIETPAFKLGKILRITSDTENLISYRGTFADGVRAIRTIGSYDNVQNPCTLTGFYAGVSYNGVDRGTPRIDRVIAHPNDLKSTAAPGFMYFDVTDNRNKTWDGSRFTDDAGWFAGKHSGESKQKPALNNNKDWGYRYFDTSLNKNVYWTPRTWLGNGGWVDVNGHTAAAAQGTTAQRPTNLNQFDVGYQYYDTELNKLIIMKSKEGGVINWVEADGAAAGVARSGKKRPRASEIYVGFVFFDTSLSPARPVYASKITGDAVIWVDATGTVL